MSKEIVVILGLTSYRSLRDIKGKWIEKWWWQAWLWANKVDTAGWVGLFWSNYFVSSPSCPQQSLGDYTSPSSSCPADNPSHPPPLLFFSPSHSLFLPPSIPSFAEESSLILHQKRRENQRWARERGGGGEMQRKGGNRAYITTEFVCMHENVCIVLSCIAFCFSVYLHECWREAENRRRRCVHVSCWCLSFLSWPCLCTFRSLCSLFPYQPQISAKDKAASSRIIGTISKDGFEKN